MSNFEIKVEIRSDLRERLGAVLPRAVEESVAAVAREVRNQVLINVTGRVLKVRGGALRRSWSGMPEVHRAGIETTATVSSQANSYAAIHEYGGDITPKNAKHLAIPLQAMQKGSGEARASARDVIANPGAYGFAGTFTAKGVIFGKLGLSKTGRQKMKTVERGPVAGAEGPTNRVKQAFVPLFALKDRVTIPARHYISLAIAQASGRAQEIVNAQVVKALGAGGGE